MHLPSWLVFSCFFYCHVHFKTLKPKKWRVWMVGRWFFPISRRSFCRWSIFGIWPVWNFHQKPLRSDGRPRTGRGFLCSFTQKTELNSYLPEKKTYPLEHNQKPTCFWRSSFQIFFFIFGVPVGYFCRGSVLVGICCKEVCWDALE